MNQVQLVDIRDRNIQDLYRATTLQEYLGNHVQKETLQNSMHPNARMPKAYIISGDTGVGKTTVVRAMARQMNCLVIRGNPDPNCQCDSCMQFGPCNYNYQNYPDLKEKNGADDAKKIDDIRSLIEQDLRMIPKYRYKIAYIDEVHQLSNDSREALLKHLEHPLPTVVWMVSTTEECKIFDKVSDRTLHVHLDRPSVEEATGRLIEIAALEGKNISSDLAMRIAISAQCNMRRAIANLGTTLNNTQGTEVTEVAANFVLASVKEDEAITALQRALYLSDPGGIMFNMQSIKDLKRAAANLGYQNLYILYQLGILTGQVKYNPYYVSDSVKSLWKEIEKQLNGSNRNQLASEWIQRVLLFNNKIANLMSKQVFPFPGDERILFLGTLFGN